MYITESSEHLQYVKTFLQDDPVSLHTVTTEQPKNKAVNETEVFGA